MKRKIVQDIMHVFSEHPFEALCCGSWHDVDCIEIRNGDSRICFIDEGHQIEEKGPFSNIRVKSRPATMADCNCYLRTGVDVCVYVSPEVTENLDEEESSEQVWIDARICSVERMPHESKCKCKFFVNRYVDLGPLGSEKLKLSKKSEAVGIEQISILRKLGKFPCEGQFYRWDSSENCTSVMKTKLFLGKFLADVGWLLAASVLKQSAFDIKSVQNKIAYQIMTGENDPHFINFKLDNKILTSIVVQIGSVADSGEKKINPDTEEDDQLPSDDIMNLRRSKRRLVQPERFLGSDILLPYTGTGWVRELPYTPDKWKEEEEWSMTLAEFISNYRRKRKERTRVDAAFSCRKMQLFGGRFTPKTSVGHFKRIGKARRGRPRKDRQGELETELAMLSVPDKIGIEAYEKKLRSRSETPRDHSYYQDRDRYSSSYYESRLSAAEKMRNTFDLEDLVFESKWRRKTHFRKGYTIRRSFICRRRNEYGEPKVNRRPHLSVGAYNKLINSYMRNIDSTIKSQEEANIMDQWEDFKAKTNRPDLRDHIKQSLVEDGEELSEIDLLWREMELCLASAYLLEEEEARVSSQPKQGLNCQHEFKLNEEIGILCQKCGFVQTEIKYVSAPFVEHKNWTTENNNPTNEENVELNVDIKNGGLNISGNVPNEDIHISEMKENVWALIPDLRCKLHVHQKKAFEFLWRNIAGSLIPAKMEKAARKTGGCVVSHTPGAGKTFLMIAFLVSYLKLFPGKRPLVLAPKTTLYTWYKEFIKWDIPLPVHLIHGRRTYTAFRQNSQKFRGVGPKPNQDVMHILDCLEKIQKWHAQPSVLVMGYTSFLTLMREDVKFDHRKYMAKVLRESPGILILDEGHNPRSTKSRLRKVLMKSETDLRVLLSGTLFQNNFCEYFNTLSLARPKFIREVLKKLDPKYKSKAKKARHLLESRARKLFIDNIGRKIDSNDSEERVEGINMLKKMTNKFIDVYEGGSSDVLPGLQIYTILMNSTDTQHEILVKLHEKMGLANGYPLEIELLITLAAIHPWLIGTSYCVHKFFTDEELMMIDKLKFDIRKASKVMFVLNLVYRVIRREKVLIFCHNIAPIRLFVELFETVFRWQKGREIMILTGDLELFERGRIIDKFEEPGGPSRVLLASITACAEGISLTAASRVIMLDSEWNPSKTKQAIARAFRPGQQKMVYVYQLLATGTLEEDKYRRTTWKEWVSCMIFSEAFVEDPSRWQAEKIEDDVLREMVEEDRVKSFHMIMKNEKASRT